MHCILVMSGDLGMAPMPSVSQISMVLAMVVCRHSGRSPFSKRGHSESVTAPAGREQPAENEWGIIPGSKAALLSTTTINYLGPYIRSVLS